MKATIEIWNQNTGISLCTLSELREMNCNRRKRILSGEGLAKVAQKKINVHTTDKLKYQKCCHYTSFQLRRMNAKNAIEIFNHDGSQKAKLTYEKAN
jgi:hypothetical protein